MQLFDLDAARKFVAGFSSTTGPPAGPIQDFLPLLKGHSKLVEGQAAFNGYRDCVLREADRRLFLAASNYRRAHDLMVGSAAHWTHVTLYYSAFYAVTSTLAQLGGWVDANQVVHVNRNTPGSQELTVVGKAGVGKLTPYAGRSSHKMLWDIYYGSVAHLSYWVPGHLTLGITPVNSDPMWLIDVRNQVNYRSRIATDVVEAFQASFDPAAFPASLGGNLATLYRVSGEMVELAAWLANELELKTDALLQVQPAGTRRVKTLAAFKAPAAALPFDAVAGRLAT